MIYTDTYKINLIGGSYRITVPIEWVRKHGITSKTELKMVVGDFVLILPPGKIKADRVAMMMEDCKKLIEMMQREDEDEQA